MKKKFEVFFDDGTTEIFEGENVEDFFRGFRSKTRKVDHTREFLSLHNEKRCPNQNKIMYANRKNATGACKTLKDISLYKCEACGSWHVTTSLTKKFKPKVTTKKKILSRMREKEELEVFNFYKDQLIP